MNIAELVARITFPMISYQEYDLLHDGMNFKVKLIPNAEDIRLRIELIDRGEPYDIEYKDSCQDALADDLADLTYDLIQNWMRSEQEAAKCDYSRDRYDDDMDVRR